MAGRALPKPWVGRGPAGRWCAVGRRAWSAPSRLVDVVVGRGRGRGRSLGAVVGAAAAGRPAPRRRAATADHRRPPAAASGRRYSEGVPPRWSRKNSTVRSQASSAAPGRRPAAGPPRRTSGRCRGTGGTATSLSSRRRWASISTRWSSLTNSSCSAKWPRKADRGRLEVDVLAAVEDAWSRPRSPAPGWRATSPTSAPIENPSTPIGPSTVSGIVAQRGRGGEDEVGGAVRVGRGEQRLGLVGRVGGAAVAVEVGRDGREPGVGQPVAHALEERREAPPAVQHEHARARAAGPRARRRTRCRSPGSKVPAAPVHPGRSGCASAAVPSPP